MPIAASQSKLRIPKIFLIMLIVLLLFNGCGAGLYSSQWTKFDETMKAHIGVKDKDYFITSWGPSTKRAQLDDGGEVLTWEWEGYTQDQYGGHSQGWKKTLIFLPNGILKNYKWEYWGMPYVILK